MSRLPRYLGQAVVYGLFALLIAYFSHRPPYRALPEDHAVINLTFAHGGKPKGGCRDRTAEELAKLPANMRKTRVCPRERLPVVVEFDLDGQRIYADSLPPTGLRGDGPSRTYENFVVPVGRHTVVFRLRDSDRADGFDYVSKRTVELAAGQHFGVDFDAEAGGFIYR